MQIDIQKLKIIPICMVIVLLTETSLMFSAIEQLQLLSYLSLGIVLLSFVVVAYVYFRHLQKNVFDVCVLCYLLLIIASSVINGTDIKDAIYRSVETALFVMLISYYRDNVKMIVIASTIAISFAVYVNFLHMMSDLSWILDKAANAENDTETSGFLLGGNYNQFGCRMICGLISTTLCLKFSKKWLLNLIPLALVSLVTLGMVSSMTSFGCILVFLILSMMPSVRLIKVGTLCILIVYLLFQIFVVFNGDGIENNEFARYIVEDIMGKDITFTRRTEMWDAALRLIGESPLIGYGFVDSEWYTSNMVGRAIGPHNWILSVLIFGGILLLAIMVYVIVISVAPIWRMSERIPAVVLAGVMMYMVIQLMEVFPYFFFFYLLSLLYYYPKTSSTPQLYEL